MQPSEKLRFGFGKNWENFIKKNYSEERLEIARKHILDFLKMDNLDGLYFLDVGCGSGLHSMGAYMSGASRIFSFDYDVHSVETTKKLREMCGSPKHWEVVQGSVLDKEFLKGIAPADIVYSWGVLHHTGDMWTAMDNVTGLMKENGLLYVALYTSDAFVNPPPEFWLDIKKRYNQGGWFSRKKLELWYIFNYSLGRKWSALPGLVKRAINYKQSRGMDFYTDVKDWLGGWPMEFASIADVQKFYGEERHLTQVKMKAGEANTEYLYRKVSAQ